MQHPDLHVHVLGKLYTKLEGHSPRLIFPTISIQKIVLKNSLEHVRSSEYFRCHSLSIICENWTPWKFPAIQISVLPQTNFKAWWEGEIWVEPLATSKLLHSSHSHIKEKSVLKACWTDMPYVCWGEHCRFIQNTSSPSSPAEQCCVSPKDKAVFITLTIGQHNVTELSHHRPSTLVHQLQRSEVIRLLKAMLVWEPENYY